MQIIPTNTSLRAPNFEDAIAQSVAHYMANFADTLNQAKTNLGDELFTEEEHDELKEESKETDVYARSANGVTYSLDEVCFTQQEVGELVNSLQKNGAPLGLLGNLQKLANVPDGANLGQVLTSLRGRTTGGEISDEDANEITALLGNIDPSGVLGTNVLDALYKNDPRSALRQIHDAMAESDPSAIYTVNKSEILALGRACGIKDLDGIEAMFGDSESGMANAGGLDKLLAPISEKVLSEQANKNQLEMALQKTIGPLLQQARLRMQQEAQAGQLKDRSAGHSQVMIDQTVQEKSRANLHSALDSMREERENMLSQGVVDGMPKDHREQWASESFLNHDSAGSKQNGHNDAWKDLLTHVNVQSQDQVKFPEAPLWQTQFNFVNMPNAEMPSLQGGQNLPMSQYVADQVQNGLFQTLSNGATRLDLQLHPQELGTITVTLTAAKGEISALIRADSAETVEMLHKQAEHIRQNLEDQGIRVDRIEVQLAEKNSDSADYNTWTNAEHHNSFQEENARREQLRRLRTLANIENSRNGADQSNLERSVHGEEGIAKSSSLLDRVA